MNRDWSEEPEGIRWIEHVRTEMIPKLAGSAATISLVPTGETDVKFAVELGMSIMLEKPIILMVVPGAHVPKALALIADSIVEGDPGDRGFPARLKTALDKVLGPGATS